MENDDEPLCSTCGGLAPCTLGEVQAHVPAVHSPKDDELGQGFRKNSGLLGVNERAESDEDCAQILCVYILHEWARACPN
jgi:hypothetical protein